MMNTDDKITGPINLGNPGEFTILELARKIISLADSKSQIKYLPLPSDDPMQRQPDISQAKAVLNWEPDHDLEDGLLKTIAYFKETLQF